MKYIILTLGFIIVLLFFTTFYYRQSLYENQQKTELYARNSRILINKIRSIYDEKEKFVREVQLLSEAAENDKAYFDWHRDISHSLVIKRLQQN